MKIKNKKHLQLLNENYHLKSIKTKQNNQKKSTELDDEAVEKEATYDDFPSVEKSAGNK